MAEYEDVIEEDVGQVGDYENRHGQLRIADAFEELFECTENHHRQRTQRHKPIVRHRHIDHFTRLSETIQQRSNCELQRHNRQSDDGIKQDCALQAVCRFALFALHEQFADYRSKSERDAHAEKQENMRDNAAECHSRQRNRVVAAIGTRHGIVGKGNGNHTELRHRYGKSQTKVGEIL